MAEYRQLEDGSFVKRRASGWEPVSAEEVAAQDQGRLERGGRAILGGAESLVRGGAAALDELVGDPRGPMAPESAAENLARWKETQAELEGISKVDPAVGLLRYAPETVVGSAGLGTGLGVRAAIGGEAALGAGLGAASDPEHPLRGAAIGGVAGGLGGAAGEGLGQMARGVGRTLGPAEQRLLDVVTMRPGQRRGNSMAADIIREADRVAGAGGEVETIAAGRDRLAAQMGNNPLTGARSMPADPAAAAGRRSVGAAEVTGDTQPHLGGGRQLEGLADSTEMLDSGFPMSETQARILDTPDGLELQQLRSLDDMEDVQSRTRPVHARVLEAVGAAPKGMDRAELAHEQQAWLNKYVSEEFGITGRSALTPGSVQQRMGELNAEFERIIGETPGPIDMKGVNQEWERILDKNMLRQGNPAYAEAEREYVDLASRVEKDAGGNLKSGDPRKLAQMRNKLTAKIDAAKSKPRLQEVAEVLEELRDVIDERFRKNWTPEMAEDHGRAQKQWWIGKALQKTGAAVGARGDVNLPTFMSNYEGSGAGRKTALLIAANRDFYRKLRGASAVMMKETGNTGSGQTAAQGMAALAGDTLMSMIPGGSLLRGLGGTMTEILIAAGEPWSVTVNGELVASSDRGPPPEPPEPEPDPDWPVIPRELVDRALGFPLPVYKNSSNASSNYGAIGTGLFATIYAWLGGDRRQEVQENIEAILENLTNPSKCPCGMSGPGAAQEAYALAWFHLYRASDLWAGTDPVKKTRIDAIFLALALIRAWEGNDKSPSEGHWTITGATDTDLKDIGPNISFSIPAQLVLCAEWVGQAELVDWLDEVTVADAREMVEEALGAGSKLYMTLNWANEGIDAEELAKVDYYRAGTSDEAPTDEEIETGLRGLTYYGAPLSDLARFLLPNDERGFNKVLPPTKRSQGSNEFIGANQYAVEGDQGTQVDGKKRGYCINDGPGMPWHGEEGAMVYEINGVDEGGLRSSMGYAFWTVYLVNAMLLPLKLHANPVLADPGVADFLTRWGKARDILGHFDANDYNSVAHIKNKGGTGGPGPVIWSDGREDWEPELNFLIWAAALPS